MILMSRHQFETDLTHLEQIIPLLVGGNPLALSYWRRRISSLSTQQGLLPDGKRRVIRLLDVFDEVERALIAGNATARQSPGWTGTRLRSGHSVFKSDNSRSNSPLVRGSAIADISDIAEAAVTPLKTP
jgi:hypothetical protein